MSFAPLKWFETPKTAWALKITFKIIFNIQQVENEYPMARRTKSHAINEVAAAAAKESLLNRRMWCTPARHDASPTIHAIKVIGRKKNCVTLLPTQTTIHHQSITHSQRTPFQQPPTLQTQKQISTLKNTTSIRILQAHDCQHSPKELLTTSTSSS